MNGSLANLSGLTPALTTRLAALDLATGMEGTVLLSAIKELLNIANSSFTATATGMTTAPTGSVTYAVAGNLVVLDFPAISGTSNATTFTLTGVPAALRPATAKLARVTITDNTGTAAHGMARIETDGTISLFVNAALGAFTGSGTKSITACSVAYTLA
mgnify:CR=1 FL=1